MAKELRAKAATSTVEMMTMKKYLKLGEEVAGERERIVGRSSITP